MSVKNEMPVKVAFFVAGQPMPQSRPRVVSKGGRTWSYSSASAGLAAWRKSIHWAAKAAGPLRPSRAHRAEVVFYFARPKAHFKGGEIRCGMPVTVSARPDLDNLVKAVLDSVQSSGLLADDSSVVWLTCAKFYVPHEGTGVKTPGAHCVFESIGGTL